MLGKAIRHDGLASPGTAGNDVCGASMRSFSKLEVTYMRALKPAKLIDASLMSMGAFLSWPHDPRTSPDLAQLTHFIGQKPFSPDFFVGAQGYYGFENSLVRCYRGATACCLSPICHDEWGNSDAKIYYCDITSILSPTDADFITTAPILNDEA